MSTKYTFPQLKSDYDRRWTAMAVTAARKAQIDTAARKILSGKERYEAVSIMTGVPWAFIGVLHYRESACDFRGVLHNGERILGTGRKTALVPKGRGPFGAWEDAAFDALGIKGYKPGAPAWSISRCLFEGERFNGFGYRQYRGIPTPYLWSGTNQYTKGKYVADGKYDANTVDKQLGIAPIMRRLMELDATVSFDTPTARTTIHEVNVADGLDFAEVQAVQQRLRDLGYAMVGRVDGLWGPNTIAGVSAFQATEGLTVTGDVNADTQRRLAIASPRPINEARASITAKDLAQAGDEVVKAAIKTKRLSLGLGGLGVGSVLIGVIEHIKAASEYLAEPLAILGAVPGWVPPLLIGGVAAYLYANAGKAENAKVQAVRAGEDVGVA